MSELVIKITQMQREFLEILNNIKLFDKIHHFLTVCNKATLLDVKYSYKQIFDQCKNMDLNSTNIRDSLIYLDQLLCQKICLQDD